MKVRPILIDDTKNEKAEFKSIFNDCYNSMKKCAFVYTNNQDVAEDMVQDVFFKIWHKRHKLKINASIKSYLMQCVKNRCIEYLRQEKQINISKNKPTDKTESQFISKLAHEPGLSFLFELEIEQIVQKTLNKLPEKTHQIFFMSRYQQLNHAKIASHFNISEKAIEYHITKALGLLKSKLHDFVT